MPHQKVTALNRAVYVFISIAFLQIFLTGKAKAQSKEYFNPYTEKPFYVAFGAGFGISNNPIISGSESGTPGGITLAACIGFRFSNRFSLEIGPSAWIESKDIFQRKVPSEERISNKRTFATLSGNYLISKHFPLSLKLGIGIGNMVYTKETTTVAVDGINYSETEYYNGAAITAGFIYQIKMSGRINILPSVNFYYCNLNPQKIEYASDVDHNSPSITTDLRIRFLINL